jgi:acyl carrier protein phosphodiesterase
MNYLAHLYLSQADNNLILGNFVADFVKGVQYQNFNPEVARGILMHREIDSITDSHLAYLEVKKLFRQSHGRYSGIVSDIVFDYILAKNWENLNNISLIDFQKKINRILISNFPSIPLKAKIMVPFFVRNRWLLLYENKHTLNRVLAGMSRYRGITGSPSHAIELLSDNETMIETAFFQTIKMLVYSLKKHYTEISEVELKLKRY